MTNDNYIQWTMNPFKQQGVYEKMTAHFEPHLIREVLAFQQTHATYTKTPLHTLDALATKLGVARIYAKDESKRFGLNAFKVLGGIYAIAKYIANHLNMPFENLSFEQLRTPEVKKQLGTLTFISATDGNHGRGVAWAARELGHESIIYMPKGSSQQRLEAIRAEGANASIRDVNYDECVRECAKLADEHGYIVVQDTAWPGYQEIPLWIMQGYASIAYETVEQLAEAEVEPPTHIFLQAGVGSFAASIAAYFSQLYQDNPPVIVVAEAVEAACYYKSFLSETGDIQIVDGDMPTIMAGLACGEPNTDAYEILRHYAMATFACTNEIAATGMRQYANPVGADAKIISGESGAVTLGLVVYLQRFADKEIRKQLQLNEQSRVLVISTEGNTDEAQYDNVTVLGHYPLDV
ncbi:MAG: diaminopropionate ammonia-lyase [Solibacillus sp.]